MNGFLYAAAIAAVLMALFYALWISGLMVISSKRAALFVGSLRGKRRCKLKFERCSGHVKRVIRLEKYSACTFSLQCALTKGMVSATLQNASKECLLRLTPTVQTGTLHVGRATRYYLVLTFENADGRLLLKWK